MKKIIILCICLTVIAIPGIFIISALNTDNDTGIDAGNDTTVYTDAYNLRGLLSTEGITETETDVINQISSRTIDIKDLFEKGYTDSFPDIGLVKAHLKNLNSASEIFDAYNDRQIITDSTRANITELDALVSKKQEYISKGQKVPYDVEKELLSKLFESENLINAWTQAFIESGGTKIIKEIVINPAPEPEMFLYGDEPKIYTDPDLIDWCKLLMFANGTVMKMYDINTVAEFPYGYIMCGSREENENALIMVNCRKLPSEEVETRLEGFGRLDFSVANGKSAKIIEIDIPNTLVKILIEGTGEIVVFNWTTFICE